MTFLSPTFIFLFLPLMLAVYAPISKFRKTDIIPVIGTVFFVCININSPIGLVYLVFVQALIIVSTAAAKKTKKKYPFAVCRAVPGMPSKTGMLTPNTSRIAFSKSGKWVQPSTSACNGMPTKGCKISCR